jgi:HAD superfamily 5'-nucleotidase-like hydrolase
MAPVGSVDPQRLHAELRDLLGQKGRELDVSRARRIYVNRNLRMDEIDVIGFDMDYTLAIYNQPNLEKLSTELTLAKMVARGYEPEIQGLDYDTGFARRGLVVDRRLGNICKMNRFGHVGRVFHGHRSLQKDERHRLYRREHINLSSPRYAWIDTLFSLPEAMLYARLVAYLDAHGGRGGEIGRVSYSRLWQDIRESIDEAHRDDTLKSVIRAHLDSYFIRDPDLAATLHKFRSSGKRLFLLTNSLFDYTDQVLSFLLDGQLPAYPSWKSYFDIIVVGAQKPAFFTERHPFLEIDPSGKPLKEEHDGPLARGHIYQGGNLRDFERMAAFGGGDRVLYIGDHIYGDMLRAKKSSVWRTAMIVEELEREIEVIDQNRSELAAIDELDRRRQMLDSELNYQQLVLKSLQKHGELHGDSPALEAARRQAKLELDNVRANLRDTLKDAQAIETRVDQAFNPYWGPMFRESNENSRFGEQVEDYACLYTSRVSNFLAYSPLQYFRSPRDYMPHEILDLPSGGSEGN